MSDHPLFCECRICNPPKSLKTLEDEIAALRARVAELERQLAAEQERSEGWRDRAGAATQLVAELEKALDAEKKQSAFYDLQAQRVMVQRDAAESRASAAEQRAEKAEAALQKINALRNDIVGMQAMGFSRHVYPLVAILNEAGMVGAGYKEARAAIEKEFAEKQAAEQRAKRMEGALKLADELADSAKRYGQTKAADEHTQIMARCAMWEAGYAYEKSRAALAASEAEVSHG